MTQPSGNGAKVRDKAIGARALPKRFYTSVAVAAAAPPRYAGDVFGFAILLDGKPVRTPAKAPFAVPTRALAEAVAAEWERQAEFIDPTTMPLTRLSNSAIDGVRGREAEVRADIAKYAASDLVCYRAEGPEELVRRQSEVWDPIVAWSSDTLGVRFAIARGIMPVAQPETAQSGVSAALADGDAFVLAALHVMTTLMGSALLALAHARGHVAADAAWAAAHVDEDWQISQWGEDAEAAARRQRRSTEMHAASHMLVLLGRP